MKRVMLNIAALGLLACFATAAIAGPGKKTAPKCPACHMVLSTKKTKMTPIAVKIKGKTYYCCAGCAMKHEGATTKKGHMKKM